jgi:signal transduction histidine kinase
MLGNPVGIRSGPRRVSAVTILVALVMLLVPALAWMQYQWLGQLSTAERERMQRTLRTAAAQFATEFDSDLSRTLVGLQLDAQTVRDQNWTAYAQKYSGWASSSSEPRVVRDVWLVDTLPGTQLPALDAGMPVPLDRMRIRKWNTQSLVFEDAAWPDDLVKMRDSLATRVMGFQTQRRSQNDPAGMHREANISLALGDDNTLIAPVTLFELGDERRGPPKITVLGFTIVRLDPSIVRNTLLTALTTRHFHADNAEVDYRIAVVQKRDPSNVVWESEPGVAAAITASPDVTQDFMGPRADQMFIFARNLRGETVPVPPVPALPGTRNPEPGTPNPEPGTATDDMRPNPAPGLPPAGARVDNVIVSMIEREGRGREARVITRGATAGEGRWVLMAKHRSGSLEAAVAAVRTRNLAISSSVLLLLTMAVGLIAVSARRAQNLARQQMEFVAAVSHELRTPVSVIGAAAGNLADGVVGDPQRVRKYGETIQGEARRLAETVERVLQLAGIAAGHAAAAQAPVSPGDLVGQSIAACRTEIEGAGVHVDLSVADGLPNVVGDPTALKSALQNLISNAVKYGGPAKWLRVSARCEPGTGNRDQVVFAVEDRGIGIEAADRKHIFEPFYRGRDAVSQQIQGSGLGLNLVMRIAEAHGGRVSVTSEPGKGSTFTLALPASRDRAAGAHESLNLAGQTTSPR